MSITIDNKGRYTIVGLTPKEMACFQMGLSLLHDAAHGDEDYNLPNWGGNELESHWPHEIERNNVSCGEIRTFDDSFWNEYEAKVHAIQTTRDIRTAEQNREYDLNEERDRIASLKRHEANLKREAHETITTPS